MPKYGVSPNIVSFNSAISACHHQPDQALEILTRISDAGIMPDAISFNAVMSAYEKTGQWGEALRIMDKMQQCGVKPTVVTYTTAINACAKAQQWELSVKLLDETKAAGISPNSATVNVTINACKSNNQWQLATMLVADIPLARPTLEKRGDYRHGPCQVPKEDLPVKPSTRETKETSILYPRKSREAYLQGNSEKSALPYSGRKNQNHQHVNIAVPTKPSAKSTKRNSFESRFPLALLCIALLCVQYGLTDLTDMGLQESIYWCVLVVLGYLGVNSKFASSSNPRNGVRQK
jgi:pentatricopeptide repeat protein